jgi:putative membrane protein
MDRILVLTVDRDDDLGNKTSIRGPVVGRRSVLTAALKLGMADPEESDTNAILGALAQYDRLLEGKSSDDEVEVAVLTGDEKVGQRSDRAISAQLDEVVNTFQPDRCIVVTDGAEDEAVLPLIQSRVKIEHVEKIIVKQSKGIEGTYYYIVKALEDPKWRSRFMIPAGLILAILGLGVMLPDAIGSIVLGALPKGAGIDDNVNRVVQEMRENADAAMFTSLLWTGTLFSALFAFAEGWRQYDLLTTTGPVNASVWLDTLHSALPWIILAFLTSTAGFMLLRIKRGNFSGRMIILSIFGLVVHSFIDSSLNIASEVLAGDFTFEVTSILSELTMPMIWIVVLWFAMTVNRSLKGRQPYSVPYRGI